ncbi:cysteine synthase [Dacryopinax primogenitus]|uniref:cysteine synthase n=1 Tax=Dacryopinax primogenitus (strain DJM 731) TaxID=1858805 RepID=M5GAH5_DACPD|nr:cysteine synthase [Dacryopinax primogenitus]EJU05844.1 cysteine synthase [Dacryopinax primogenitus]
MSTSTSLPLFSLSFWRSLWPPHLPHKPLHALLLGILAGLSISLSSASVGLYLQQRRREALLRRLPPRPIEIRRDEVVKGVMGLIGNTPLMRIESLSEATGCNILGKCEFLNPGGSVKDRVALKMIEDAEAQGMLHPNTESRIFEGTVGSTGISLATVARARGYETTIIMPDDVSAEKRQTLLCLSARVEQVRPASIVDQKQFVNLARQRALSFGRTKLPQKSLLDAMATPTPPGEDIVVASQVSTEDALHEAGARLALEESPRGFFADQFENLSNHDAHYLGTGPEIWRQTNGNVDAFVSGAGTGGTIAGTGQFLKEQKPEVVVALADPEGSGLYNKIKFGVMYDPREKEGSKRRHQVDTVVEGIGINRLTKNFELGLPIIDTAYRVTDPEAVAMSRHLVKHDGLFLGSSSACNLVACVRLAHRLGRGHTIVTILCDSGNRHYSKFWNDEYLRNANIPIDLSIVDDLIAGREAT